MPRTHSGENFDELFFTTIASVNQSPEYESAPRGMKIREVIAPTLVLHDPRSRLLSNTAREANYGFAVGEFLWYWAGRQDLKSLLYYNKRAAQFSDNGTTVNSAYGFRIKTEEYMQYHPNRPSPEYISQWQACKETLLKDRDSRRALLIINRAEDNTKAATIGSKDVPCTLSLQFFIRYDKLVLHVHMRSNDAVWGLTYDLFSFTLLQECMLLELRAAGLDIELGEYIHTAGSLHIYEQHFKMASAVTNTYLTSGFKAAAPMEPIDLEGLSLLIEQEEALRLGRVAQLDEDHFGGGTRWMCRQLNANRRKRDDERR
jgi:thymidylate synthase